MNTNTLKQSETEVLAEQNVQQFQANLHDTVKLLNVFLLLNGVQTGPKN